MRLISVLAELLFPRKCVLCGSLLSREQTDLCRDCRIGTDPWSPDGRNIPSVDRVAAVWYYEGPVRESLLRYKFSGCRHYARAYARLLAMNVLRECPEADLITWIPVSPLRKLKRGYDQSELLARAVASELGLPVIRLLKKIRNNPAQSGISDPRKRKANVRNAYRTLHPEQLREKRIILLDDILTTGATAGECARMLREAGAAKVCLAVMATGRPKRTKI